MGEKCNVVLGTVQLLNSAMFCSAGSQPTHTNALAILRQLSILRPHPPSTIPGVALSVSQHSGLPAVQRRGTVDAGVDR